MNIADVVGDYVTLKTAGVGSLKGLCPFHDERSPSFHVRPQVGRYHCFGCGEDGDVFSFLMKQDHTTFSEAVERMAAKIGFTLHYEDGDGPRDRLQHACPPDRRQRGGAAVLHRAAHDPAGRPGPALPGRAWVRPGRRAALRRRVRPEVVRRPAGPPARAGLHPRRDRRGGSGQPGRPVAVRPVPRAADLADPRRHRGDDRLRRAQAARRRQGPEVPQHPRDPDLPQEPGALRARPGPT